MKKMLFTFFLFFSVNSLFSQKVINDANAVSRQVSSFHAINISSAFSVIINQGNEESLAVSANQKEYLDHIQTIVEGGVLKIWYDEKSKWWHNHRKLKAYISVKNLDEIKVSGASDIKLEGQLSSSNLKLHLSGASDFKGMLIVSGKLDIQLSGASDINITGSAENTYINASGASDVKAYDFKTGICSVDASGACSINITVDKELSAKLSGASNINYKGSAMIREIKTSGASNISHKS
jgi:putative autotransporter adhesin-like protein